MGLNFAAELAADVAASRADAEALMVDACTIAALLPREQWATDQATGVVTPAFAPAKYSGKCQVSDADPSERTPAAGGATYTVQRALVKIPAGACAAAVGDVVTITASLLDPNLAGRQFRVTQRPGKTLAVAYRLAVEEWT